MSLTNVQVTNSPAVTLIASVGLPSSQLVAVAFRVHPSGTISVTLKIPVTLTFAEDPVPPLVMMSKLSSPVALETKLNVSSPPTAVLFICSIPGSGGGCGVTDMVC